MPNSRRRPRPSETSSGTTPATIPTYSGGGIQPGSGTVPSGYAFPFETYYAGELSLGKQKGDFDVSIATIGANAQVNSTTIRSEADKEINRVRSDTDRYIADVGLQGTRLQTDAQRYAAELGLRGTEVQAGAQRYLGELGLEGTKYSADKESEWRRAVAGLEIQGRLDLQPIINAGLARVAEIEGAAARDVAETTGRYGLEATRTRSEADKAIGKMGLAGNMYGLINAAFG
jgi:hypothetical protein